MHILSRGALLVASALTIITPAGAQTQGSFGATSTGSINIEASVPARVRISGLSDVNFASADPTLPASDEQNVCVWSNTSTRGYNITATGSGAANAFTLSSGALTPVPYSVAWADSSGQTTGTALVAGSALTGLVSTAINSSCSAGPGTSASLIVSMAPSTLESMTANTSYTGALTLVVAPE